MMIRNSDVNGQPGRALGARASRNLTKKTHKQRGCTVSLVRRPRTVMFDSFCQAPILYGQPYVGPRFPGILE